MSAAEPADHTPTILTGGPGDAAVIDISTRVTQAAKGRWKDMTSPDRPDWPDDRQQQVENIEMTFNENHLSLADDDTAAVYTITLGVFRHMLKGAHARGIVDETQLEKLDEMVEGVRSAPRLV